MSGLLQHGGLMSQGAYQDIGEGLLSGRFSKPQGQGLLGALRGIGDPLYSALGVPPPPRWEDDPAAQETLKGLSKADLDVIAGMIGPGAMVGMARAGKGATKGSVFKAFKGAAESHDKFQSPDNPYAGFFSSDPRVAVRFGKGYAGTYDDGRKGIVSTVNIEMKNPKVIDAEGRHAADFQFGRARDDLLSYFNDPRYDGVILKNTKDEGDVYIPKAPEQVSKIKPDKRLRK